MGARSYRARVFEDNYEVLSRRTFVVVYDLDATGYEARQEEARLDALLNNLSRMARREDSVDPDRCRLALSPIVNGVASEDIEFEWVGRT